MKNFRAGIGKRPVIVGNSFVVADQASLDRGMKLEQAGAILVCDDVDGTLEYFTFIFGLSLMFRFAVQMAQPISN